MHVLKLNEQQPVSVFFVGGFSTAIFFVAGAAIVPEAGVPTGARTGAPTGTCTGIGTVIGLGKLTGLLVATGGGGGADEVGALSAAMETACKRGEESNPRECFA